jgi:AbrB family looped-hinge helix DNA binding protein
MSTTADAAMDTAKVTSNGQVTIPVDFRRLLNIKPGNKVLFYQRENGDVVIENASVSALKKAQSAFSGAAEDFDYANEDDILADVMRTRRKDRRA